MSPPRPRGRAERRGLPEKSQAPQTPFRSRRGEFSKSRSVGLRTQRAEAAGRRDRSGAEVGSGSGGARNCLPTAPDRSGPPRRRPHGAWAAPLGKRRRRPRLAGHLLLRLMSDSRFSLCRSSLARSAPVLLPSLSSGVAAAQSLRARRARPAAGVPGVPGAGVAALLPGCGSQDCRSPSGGVSRGLPPTPAGQDPRTAFPVRPELSGAHRLPETSQGASGRARNGTRGPRGPARAFAKE